MSKKINQSSGIDTIENVNNSEVSVPSNRMQADQQFPTMEGAVETETPKGNFSKTINKSKGTVLKQEVAAAVLSEGKTGIGGPASVNTVAKAGLKSLSYSGDAGTILGSAAGTPVVGSKDRANTRDGRKLDATNKKINYLASEQVINEYDAPLPLSGQTGPMGYGGTPKNTSARSQKNNGFTNVELLFDRSVDEIARDEAFFVSGQVVKEKGVVYDDAPTKTLRVHDDGTSEIVTTQHFTRGNFMPEEIEVKIVKDDGGVYVKQFKPIVRDLSCNNEMTKVVNVASTNAIIDMNQAEIDRQNIDSKAGRETMPNWSPLGRAVEQPSQTVSYLRDLENELGAYVYTSNRMATKAHAYQLNKAAKDGQRITGPIREMFDRHLVAALDDDHFKSSAIFEDDGTYNNVWSADVMQAGSAALMVALFDSKNKYNTKADFLTQPRSLKMHFATAANNINQYKVKPEFIAALDARDVFSTIDREYDPMMPVIITDGVKLITTHDWSKQFSYTQERNGVAIKRTWESTLFAYSYDDRMSEYVINVTNPMLAGVAYFIEQHADKIYDVLKSSSNAAKGEVTWHIPVVSTTRSFSLWDFLLLAAVPFIQYERTNCMKDVLDYELNFEYPFAQLKSVGDFIDLGRTNYEFKGITEPLITKKAKPTTAITWSMPELFWSPGIDAEGINERIVVHPFYFSEEQYEFEQSMKAVLKDDNAHMTLPVIRSGIKLGYVDDVYGLTERPFRLSYDRLVRSPYEDGSKQIDALVYKYSQNAEGHLAKVSNAHLTVSQYLSTPRELGWSLVLPAGIATNDLFDDEDSVGIKVGTALDKIFEATHIETTPSYRIVCYAAPYKNGVHDDALEASAVYVSRGQAFSQVWYEYSSIDGQAEIRANNGLIFSVAYEYENFNNTVITAFTTGYSTRTNGHVNAQGVVGTAPGLYGINKLLWARLQKLPFSINPFDCCNDGAAYDPYDFIYLFNVAGFMDSDYNEDINNRITEVQNAGWLYVCDPFIKDSYLFK